MTVSTPSQTKKSKAPAEPRLSRTRRPGNLSVEEWQIRLRRQFGQEQSFQLNNLGKEPIFSEFAVLNPDSGGRYRVAIRGAGLGENYCSCPDFATNDLGTCKHIEFTLSRLKARRGGKKALRSGFRPAYSEIFLHYAGERTVRFRSGGACPAELAQAAVRLFDLAADGVLARERFSELEGFLAAAERLGHPVRCYDDVLAFVAESRDAEHRRRVLDAAYPEGAESPALADLLQTRLYPYQIQGALFAARAGRALIGDEMGLGKTVQALAAAELWSRHFGAERILVVCPTSLKRQWQREIARFTGRESLVIQGARVHRERHYHDEIPCKIANYETLSRDLDLIRAWSPDVVIVDEAQRIKNWNTIAARALKKIESSYAIVLTGTPLENRLEELISIVQFVDRYRLGPTWKLLDEHQIHDDSGRVVGYRALDRIAATLAPVMLRRRKKEVLDQLPERVDNTLFVQMTPQQRAHHDDQADVVARIVHRWRKTGYLSDVDQRRLTIALQYMRMSCNSTFLLDQETDYGSKADELATILDELFEQPDAKAVVFSQWVRTHEVVIRRLEQRGWGYVLFHGGVPGEKRGELVDRFCQEPACRVFLSTDAGGIGLNLQHAAAVVVNMDLPWNPAILEQRIGRVYRLGQKRSVQVVNLVAQNSIEEGMLSVLAFKQSLFAGALDGGDSEVFLNGTRLSKFMESVEEVTGTLAAAPPAEETGEGEGEAGAVEAVEPVAAPVQQLPEVEPAPVVPQPVPKSAPREAADGVSGEVAVSSVPAAPETGAATVPVNPWAPLLDVGLKLVETLAAAQAGGRVAGGSGGEKASGPASWIETDAATGKSYVKLPVPEPETVQRLAEALTGLLAGLRR